MQNQHIIAFILLIGFPLMILTSCQPYVGEKMVDPFTNLDTFAPPQVIKASNPVINFLDTCPHPKVVNLSAKPKPVVSPVDFYIPMQNYNTEQGLALSSILCGFMDKSGNLWFGSSGNGVSKYDGKSFTNYYSSHGLIHNLINSISEDRMGNLWFATYGGVSKYNGKYFENYTTEHGLPNNDINKIFEDSRGNIWISTTRGLARIDPEKKGTQSGMFINYNEDHGLPGPYIGEIIEDSRGNLWFGTDYGISKYDPAEETRTGKAFVNYAESCGLAGKVVNDIAEDNNGNLWIGTDQGVSKYDPKKEKSGELAFINYTSDDGLVDNYINCIHIDKVGNVWFGTSGGVSEYRKGESVFINYTTAQGLANNLVYSITEGKAGSLWFSTMGGGLSRYDGSAIIAYSAAQGLAGNAIYCSSEDREGNLWFGSDNAGITKFGFDGQGAMGNYFVNYAADQGLSDNSILTMIPDRSGNLWFGTTDGLSKYDGKSFVTYTSKQGLVKNYVSCLTEDTEGNIWIGTYEGGVSMFDGSSFTNYNTEQGLVHNTVWSILDDERGNIWFATRGGLSIFNGTHFINYTKAQGLPDNKLSTVIKDKTGNIMIGSWGGGVSVIRKNKVDSLIQHNSTQTREVIFENYSTNEGLSNDVIYGILEDSTGNIFIGTNMGITVLKGGVGPSTISMAKDGIENFNQKTGYPIKDISNNCGMLLDSKGIIWAGTGDKMVRFDYHSVHRNSEAPQVSIQSVKINNEKISWYSLQRARGEKEHITWKSNYVAPYITDEQNVFGRKLTENERNAMINKYSNISFDSIKRFYAIPENLILPFSWNTISFDFVGIETTRSFLVRYQYMLEGFDEKWSPVSDIATAHYGNLPNGVYTFLLKAQDADGVWSEPIVYNFEILPPWYRSWPAYIVYFMILVAGIFLVDRYQRKRLILKERERTMNRELDQAKEIEIAYNDLKSTQAQLVHAEKMASLGELTAGISHEIQNPLNFVNNFSEVSIDLMEEMGEELSVGNTDDAKTIANDLMQNLEKINHHGQRASSIIKGMLEHSRVSNRKKEPTDINVLADEYLRLAYHGLRAKDKSFNADFKADLDKSIPKIKVIPQDIGRVLLNLINNAFYAVAEKQKQLNNDFKPVVLVSTKKMDGKIEIAVRDNGNGIPEKVLEKIFQPFFTTKPTGEGTGLGLSLSYDIITKGHGGKLKVKTKKGEGAEFTITLPHTKTINNDDH